MSKKIIIHVGTHKTGTTSIQKFLRKNTDLLASDGFYIPRAGTINCHSGHHNLAWEANEDGRFDRDLGSIDDLAKELAPIDLTAIISSEDFEFLSFRPERLRQFHARLTEMAEQVEYFVTFREQDSYAKSLYAELLTNRFDGTYEEFQQAISNNQYFTFEGNTFDFDPVRFKKNWVSVTGDCITSLEYELSLAEGLLPSFMKKLGVSAYIIDASGWHPEKMSIDPKSSTYGRK